MSKPKNALLRPAGFAIAFCQRLSAAFFNFVMRHVWAGYDATIDLPELRRDQRYVIAANHQAHADCFAIYAPLNRQQRWRIAPVKLMLLPKLYHKWWLKPFAFLLGAYPAHIKERNHHTYGIEGSIKLLRYGYNICIFPEGGLTAQAESTARPGVSRILEGYPDAILLLAHIEWIQKHKKRQYKIVIAPAPPDLDKSDPKAIMNAIYAL